MNFAEITRSQCPWESFSDNDLRLIFQDYSDSAIHSGVSRALRSQDFVRLKRGLYIFGERLRRKPVSKMELANRLYTPSYVSFETALSHYGLIPEAVYVTTSASTRRQKKRYQTPLGIFDYDYIPRDAFFRGVIKHQAVVIAEPVKALFDWVYSRKRYYSDLSEFLEDTRIDLDELMNAIKSYSVSDLEELAKSYSKKRTTNLLKILRGL